MIGRATAALLAAAVLAAVLLAFPSTALAHAVLLRSDPPDACSLLPQRLPPGDPRCAAGAVLATPPTAVHLWFSEPVQPFAGGISVTGPSGRRADRGRVRVDGTELSIDVDTTEPGTYLVHWRVTSGDTHPVRGAFAFSSTVPSATFGASALQRGDAGGVSAPGLALQVVSRWLHFAGYALGFGTLVILLVVLRPLGIELSRRLWRIVNLGVLALLFAGLLALISQIASLTPDQILDPDAFTGVIGSSFGRILGLQVGAALLLWVLLGMIERGSIPALRAALLLGVVLAIVDGGASHSAGAVLPWLGLTLNTLHLVAMGIWAGGLFCLLFTWNQIARAGASHTVPQRFGRLAAACVSILVLTGLAMALLRLREPADLVNATYGRILVIKAIAVLAVVLVAYLGARAVVRQPASARTGPAAAAELRPARWWFPEAAGLAIVLVFAGLLVSLPPPR